MAYKESAMPRCVETVAVVVGRFWSSHDGSEEVTVTSTAEARSGHGAGKLLTFASPRDDAIRAMRSDGCCLHGHVVHHDAHAKCHHFLVRNACSLGTVLARLSLVRSC